ncbi:MAG TPA: hypothetical protein VGD40_07150 [Chryseosolibacter sp.]
MKNIFTICALAVTINAVGQQQKGDLALQFSGNYSQNTFVIDSKNYKFGYGSIYVKVGKFFTNNLELGLKPNVNFSLFTEPVVNKRGDIVDTKKTLTSNLGFGIYGTYSFLTANGKFLPYGGAEIAYAPVQKEKVISFGPYVGLRYFVTERINIDGNSSWLVNLGSTSEEPRGDFRVRPTWTYNIGVGVLIGKLND